MTEQGHVHDCTGPDMTCPCGFVFRAARFCLSFDVFDNDTLKTVVSAAFNSDNVYTVSAALRDAADRLEREVR